MKGQARIDFRTRRSRISNSETAKVKNIEDVKLTKAFRPVEHVISKPQKVEKLVVRKSTRLATKDLTQTVLDLKTIEKPTTKRKIESTASTKVNKKQKQHHDEESLTDNQTEEKNTVVETIINEKPTEIAPEIITIVNETKEESVEKVETNVENEESTVAALETDEQESLTTTVTTSSPDVSIPQLNKQSTQEEESVVEMFKSAIENTPLNHIQDDDALSNQDSLSPPSSFIEPMTPPRQAYTAPYKEYLTDADKQRIESEKTTLEKLRKSLDIVITDRAARHQPTLYHQIEAVLRNSTRRTITLSHICKIMYITPSLYTLEAKELRSFGGKVTEAFLIQFTKDWTIPLAGKDLQKRSDILKDAITEYFVQHPEPDASIPEITLPRLNLVVDKKEWMKEAQLPSGVRKLLEAHEKAKEAEIEKAKPKPKPTGSVKDRMAALRARLAKKSD